MAKNTIPADTQLILVRFSTPGNSWISAYGNADAAKKHIVDNANIHFSGEWDEDQAKNHSAYIHKTINNRECTIEIGDWNAEIEYGETIYFS